MDSNFWICSSVGLSAAISHSLLIWLLAALALHYGHQWDAEAIEPWLQIASAVLILGLALWMYLRTRREVKESAAHGHSHGRDTGFQPVRSHRLPAGQTDVADLPRADAGGQDAPGHAPAGSRYHEPHGHDDHAHGEWQNHSHTHEPAKPAGLILPVGYEVPPAPETKHGPHGGMLLDTGHGWLEISVFEDGVPPRFRVYPCKATGAPVPLPKGTKLGIETARLDGRSQKFVFEPGDGFWEATAVLPEPHEFLATVTLGHADHAHTYKLRFTEDDHHHGAVAAEIKEEGDVYQDAHERAHAEDIARRFKGGKVTTPQIILFGITGGLMPCPAAFTILLVCLQIKKAALGFTIVGAFSFGLALTMVSVGALAAWSVRHAERKFSGFSEAMRRAPYVSCVLLTLLAAYMAWSGWHGLHRGHSH